jgi:crotonobetainyl-CoA:carnitine CoA-transferase CaiB-like acyl-CoA transferase
MFKQVLYAIRVLDLAPGWSANTGRLLGDLGAEVIKIEPPAGDPLRGTANFERLNANKYGCTLDISNADGIAKLQQLVGIADIVIAPPDTVDLEALMAAKGSLITVSLPANAGAEQTIAAAAGVGVALWDRRRTGEGSRIDIAAAVGKLRTLPNSGEAIREPVSTLNGELQVESSPWRLSESATHVRLPAPGLGEHNEYAFGLLLAV